MADLLASENSTAGSFKFPWPLDVSLESWNLDHGSLDILEVVQGIFYKDMNSESHPCGKGVMYSTCRCADGRTFVPSFKLISLVKTFCHNPNSTSTQPQLNSTELGLT